METFSKTLWLDRSAPWIAFAIAAITVLVTQPYYVGFIPTNHGWVSSHYLAILQHSTWDNGFVGYTLINQVTPTRFTMYIGIAIRRLAAQFNGC